MKKGRPGRLSEHAGRNASERRAGLETSNAEADPSLLRGRLAAVGKASGMSTDRFRRGIDGGMRARERQQQHGKPRRWRARANRESARTSLGRRGGGEACSTEEAG